MLKPTVAGLCRVLACLVGLVPAASAAAQDVCAAAAAVMYRAAGPLSGAHSGTPYNDFVEYLPHMSFVSGETAGFDTFYPVACSGEWPGSDEFVTVECCQSPDYDIDNGGARGDRVVLGTARHGPFFRRGADAIDDDFVRITNFDYGHGRIQLAGSPDLYRLEHCSVATDGTRWNGWALAYVVDGDIDLIAFVDDCVPQYRTTTANVEPLELSNPVQFEFATPVDQGVELASPIGQLGTTANDSAVAVTVDGSGNIYVTGHSEGDMDRGDGEIPVGNTIWIASFTASGRRRWLRSFPSGPGGSTWELACDDAYVYAVGRDWRGASARFDAFIWKLDATSGERVAEHLYTSTELDGYGNVALADGVLYVSGQGGLLNGHDYLIAAHRSSDLANLWRRTPNPFPGTNVHAAETWGGIAVDPFANLVFTAGWWFAGLSSDGFVVAHDTLTGASEWPASVSIGSQPRRTDWALGSAIDELGNYYVAGYTTGSLGATQRGEGDLFVRKFTPGGTAVWTRQWGTDRTDSFRRLVCDENGVLYAVGYTYGDLAGSNRDPRRRTADIYVARLDRNGVLLGERQFGTEEEDRGYPWVRDGILVIAGTTEGSLTGPNLGACDGFVVRLSAETLATLGARARRMVRSQGTAPSGS